jgi:hypothetical protein
MADKIKQTTAARKNALGRTVLVKRDASGKEAVSKTRTVYSKNGGMVSTKTSYKDRGSMAGKALEKKVDKQMKMPTRVGVIQGKKPIMEKAIKMDSKPLKRNAIKLDEAKREYMRNPAKYDAAKVSKAMETGRGGKVKRVMKREMMKGRPF